MGTLVFVCPVTGLEVFTGLEMDSEHICRLTECFAGHSLSPLSQTPSTVRRDRLVGGRRASNRRNRLRRNRRALAQGFAEIDGAAHLQLCGCAALANHALTRSSCLHGCVALIRWLIYRATARACPADIEALREGFVGAGLVNQPPSAP